MRALLERTRGTDAVFWAVTTSTAATHTAPIRAARMTDGMKRQVARAVVMTCTSPDRLKSVLATQGGAVRPNGAWGRRRRQIGAIAEGAEGHRE